MGILPASLCSANSTFGVFIPFQIPLFLNIVPIFWISGVKPLDSKDASLRYSTPELPKGQER